MFGSKVGPHYPIIFLWRTLECRVTIVETRPEAELPHRLRYYRYI